MAEERRRRRRGRRRGRGDKHPTGQPPEERPEESQAEETEESEAPDASPSRRRFLFGRRRDSDEEDTGERRREDREERSAGGVPTHVSPLAFWRRGQSRTYREQPMPKQTLGRTLRRVRGMYFPPWVPVAFIIVVVFGILGALFLARGAAGAPRIGKDHWHATYQILICDERQPNAPSWGGGVHTHADGVVHIHPFTPAEEGAGARLVKWFEYGGGKLTQSEMRIPGSRDTYKNGDTCEDGSEAVLQVFVNGEKLDNWSRYLPKDGDRIRIEFGHQRSAPVELDDRTVIAEADATRTVELKISGAEADAAFAPDSIEMTTGETVKLTVKNAGAISHSVRVAGPDGDYDTSDDYVATSGDGSDIIKPEEEAVLVVRFDQEGEFEFQDPTASKARGVFVVTGAEEETPEPETDPDAPKKIDVTLEVTVNDSAFKPAKLEVKAGKTFRIKVTNKGGFVHNLRIAGPDGEYRTDDDLVSSPSPIESGESGDVFGPLAEPGVYEFRSDFPPSGEMVGTITVK